MIHPMQDTEIDKDGILRFKGNKIVRYLLDSGRTTMNDLAIMPFSQEDREQFAQLIGYSVSGFTDLSYVSDECLEKCENLYQAAGLKIEEEREK